MEIPVIETGRLRLRSPEARDFDAYAAFRASPRAAFVGGPYDRASSFLALCAIVGQWHLRGYGRWLVADRETDAPLGIVGLYHPEDWPEAEIGWSVFGPAEGRGIAAEAARAARAYAYGTLGWTRVVSLTTADNLRSQALARRLGCVLEGLFEHPVYGPLQVWRHPAPDATAEAG